MSKWSLKQWSEQLHSSDEAARHEAAVMLGEQGDPQVVPDLIEVSGREPGLWTPTNRGAPTESTFHPLCQTANHALQLLSCSEVLKARTDLERWQAYKSAKSTAKSAAHGEAPSWKESGIALLVAGISNNRHGAFEPKTSARAAWQLGEIGFALRSWELFLGKKIDWPSFVHLSPKQWGPTPPALVAFMKTSGFDAETGMDTVTALHSLIGAELVEMLVALSVRREQREPSDISSVQKSLIDSIGRIKYTDGAPAIVAALRPQWPDLSWSVVSALGELQLAETRPAVQSVLEHAQGALKARAAHTLGRLGAPRATSVLLPLLNDDDASIRTQAVRALGRLGVSQTRDRIFQMLIDSDETVRFSAGTALGLLGDVRTVPFLLKAIAEGDKVVQREAEIAMKTLGSGALTPLVQLLREGKKPYRAEAARRLGALKEGGAVRYLIPTLTEDDCGMEAAAALLRIGTPAVEDLLRYLGDDPNLDNVTPELKEHVARVLGKIGDQRTVEPMLAIVTNTKASARLREEAARVLGLLGDTRAVTPLLTALSETSSAAIHVRAEAARALGRLGSREPVLHLIDAVGDPDDKLRAYAIEALGALEDARAVEPLIQELSGFRHAGRASIIQALGRLGDTAAIEPLLDVAEEQPHTYINGYALQALARLGEASIVPLILHEREWHQELSQVLKTLGTSAMPPLVDQLRSGEKEEVRALAALSLGDLGEGRSMGSLITALQDPSKQVQKAAARALAQIHSH
ncbi:MAG: HEAT repeat domain-containing protein [Myxococcota bacterium]|nr:HEAT repeat domain-containing protein [Myxococcota bacterium]